MSAVAFAAVLTVAGYLLGSIPFGLIVARAATGVDVRTLGSGNIGATNVARVAGKKLGVLVLALDAAKGFAPAIAARLLVPDQPWIHVAAGAAAIAGHVMPVVLRFRGGKGVATSLGVFLALVPWAAAVGFALYAAIFAVGRISSVGSLVGAMGAVATAFAMAEPGPYAWSCAAALAGLLVTHRENIRRMLRREERRL